MNPEHLRNTLLVMLVVMLVYVLYKRLIHVLRKDQIKAKYPAMPNALSWSEDQQVATIELTLSKKMYLIVEVYDQHGNKVSSLAEGEFDPGVQHFEIRRSHLVPGKYYYKIISPHEQASQYFAID